MEDTDWKDQCSPKNIQANFTAETREHNAGAYFHYSVFSVSCIGFGLFVCVRVYMYLIVR